MSVTVYKTTLASPVGPLVAVASEKGLCVLEFEREARMDWLWKRLQCHFGKVSESESDHPVLALTRRWLEKYLADPAAAVSEIPLDLWGTDFELAVWQAIARIPCGGRGSYGHRAPERGRPAAARAVGGATGRNPVALVIPCHRVIGSNGAITGYGGGLDRKRWLLAHEGVGGWVR